MAQGVDFAASYASRGTRVRFPSGNARSGTNAEPEKRTSCCVRLSAGLAYGGREPCAVLRPLRAEEWWPAVTMGEASTKRFSSTVSPSPSSIFDCNGVVHGAADVPVRRTNPSYAVRTISAGASRRPVLRRARDARGGRRDETRPSEATW